MVLEIIFFPKKSCRKWPKSAIFRYFLQYQYIWENTKSGLNLFICMNFERNGALSLYISEIRPYHQFTRFFIFELCETKTWPGAWMLSYSKLPKGKKYGHKWQKFQIMIFSKKTIKTTSLPKRRTTFKLWVMFLSHWAQKWKIW